MTGVQLYRYQPTRKGDPDAPLSDTELSEKFREFVVPVVGATAAEALLQNLWSGNALPGAVPLLAQPVPRAAE